MTIKMGKCVTWSGLRILPPASRPSNRFGRFRYRRSLKAEFAIKVPRLSFDGPYQKGWVFGYQGKVLGYHTWRVHRSRITLSSIEFERTLTIR